MECLLATPGHWTFLCSPPKRSRLCHLIVCRRQKRDQGLQGKGFWLRDAADQQTGTVLGLELPACFPSAHPVKKQTLTKGFYQFSVISSYKETGPITERPPVTGQWWITPGPPTPPWIFKELGSVKHTINLP